MSGIHYAALGAVELHYEVVVDVSRRGLAAAESKFEVARDRASVSRRNVEVGPRDAIAPEPQ